MKRKTGNRRNNAIDLLRLLSCMAVLAYHFGILKGSYLAVCAFFVISGYLSTQSFLKKSRTSLSSFYLKRYARLYLPLLVCVCLMMAFIRIFEQFDWVNLRPETTSVLLGYNNYWQISVNSDYFVRKMASPFTHLWYIAILLQFYLFFPFVCIILKKTSQKLSRLLPEFILILLTAASFYLFIYKLQNKDLTGAYYDSLARCFSLFIGMTIAFFHKAYRPLTFKNQSLDKVIFIMYFLIQLFMFIFVGSDSKFFGWAMLVESIIAARLISYGSVLKFKNNPYVRYLCDLSYEIYLFHYPLIYIMDKLKVIAIIKISAVIVLTLVLSFMVHGGLNVLNRKKFLNIVLCILLCISSIYGFYGFLNSKDNTQEMADLQEKLAENQKLIEKKNKENMEVCKQRQKEWYEIVEELENEEDVVAALLKQLPVTGIGDSILIDIADVLYDYFPNGYFDGKISRDLYNGNLILEELKEEGKLADIIILCLSTNGDWLPRQNEKLIEITKGKEVFWVDAVNADEPHFNERFAEFAKDHPNIHIVEWEKAAEGHSEYFYYDGIHVMGEGVDVLSDLIYQKVYDFYLEKYRNIDEEKKEKIEEQMKDTAAFYGGDALVSVYPYLEDEVVNASYNVVSDKSFDEICKDISEKETLEEKIIFLFDKKQELTDENYLKLIELCKGKEIYICDLNRRININGAKVIDFNTQLKKHKNYLLADRIHLSEDGAKALSEMIKEALAK